MFVRNLRISLLLLLALLLPVRGAMAAAMPCLQQGSAHQEVALTGHHGGGTAPALHDHGQHTDADTGSPQQHENDVLSVGSDNCNACAGSCSQTPVALADLNLLQWQARAVLNPAPPVFAPSVVADGEERPHRTI